MANMLSKITKTLSWFWSDFVKDLCLLGVVTLTILRYIGEGKLNSLLGGILIIIFCIGVISRNIYSEVLE